MSLEYMLDHLRKETRNHLKYNVLDFWLTFALSFSLFFCWISLSLAGLIASQQLFEGFFGDLNVLKVDIGS